MSISITDGKILQLRGSPNATRFRLMRTSGAFHSAPPKDAGCILSPTNTQGNSYTEAELFA